MADEGASMRPAHSAREIRGGHDHSLRAPRASMRPAHSAREIFDEWLGFPVDSIASMRPAHSAREILTYSERLARKNGPLQ